MEFGKYRLLEKIGQGGMAEVFYAHVAGAAGFTKEVALKRVLAHLCEDQNFIKSFIDEARLGGLLNHHHIVQTIDFGHEGGIYYMAMEYVHGLTLREILNYHNRARIAIPPPIALDLVMQLADGLRYAHKAEDQFGNPLNMVHRDLKPTNILLSAHGVLKIADFGIARAETNLRRTTYDGVLKGTAQYMSPEQALGDLRIDRRSDIFSLGSISYELITLRPLFLDPTNSVKTLRNVQDAQVEGPLAVLASEYPYARPLVPLLRRLLAQNRDERPGQVDDIMPELRRIHASMSRHTDIQSWMEEILTNLGKPLKSRRSGTKLSIPVNPPPEARGEPPRSTPAVSVGSNLAPAGEPPRGAPPPTLAVPISSPSRPAEPLAAVAEPSPVSLFDVGDRRPAGPPRQPAAGMGLEPPSLLPEPDEDERTSMGEPWSSGSGNTPVPLRPRPPGPPSMPEVRNPAGASAPGIRLPGQGSSPGAPMGARPPGGGGAAQAGGMPPQTGIQPPRPGALPLVELEGDESEAGTVWNNAAPIQPSRPDSGRVSLQPGSPAAPAGSGQGASPVSLATTLPLGMRASSSPQNPVPPAQAGGLPPPQPVKDDSWHQVATQMLDIRSAGVAGPGSASVSGERWPSNPGQPAGRPPAHPSQPPGGVRVSGQPSDLEPVPVSLFDQPPPWSAGTGVSTPQPGTQPWSGGGNPQPMQHPSGGWGAAGPSMPPNAPPQNPWNAPTLPAGPPGWGSSPAGQAGPAGQIGPAGQAGVSGTPAAAPTSRKRLLLLLGVALIIVILLAVLLSR